MIKINLIQQRKIKSSDPGQQVLLAGVGGVLALGALVFFLVHRPLAAEIESFDEKNNQLKEQNKTIEARTKDFKALQTAVEVAEQQKSAIDELNGARAVPAWMLHELSKILSATGRPTMTDEAAKRVRDDPNRAWAEGWDPKHVWITSFSEKGGRFRLEGAAQSDSDMTQLALRMQASAYFDSVVPEGGKVDGKGGVSMYRFTIVGNLRY